MSTVIRPEISPKNKYWISKHRYYELKHFCLQYSEWKDELLYLTQKANSKNSPVGNSRKTFYDPTWDSVKARDVLQTRIKLIEDSARRTDEVLGCYILKAVTKGLSFVQLKMLDEIPCERDMYYDRYRRFFYILSCSRFNHPL